MTALTLTEFLLARITEDEAAARAILDHFYGEGRWRWDLHNPPPVKVALVDERGVRMVEAKGDGPTWMVTEHIARHDPARVLAECEAKRRIVAAARENVRTEAFEHGDTPRDEAQLDYWCDGDEILQALALPYAGHPDYRDKWKP